MKTWKIWIDDPLKSEIYTVEVMAPDVQAARKLCRSKGKIVKIKRKVEFSLIKAKFTIDERQIFLLRLGTMIECRLGVSEALTLIEQNFGGSIKRVANNLLSLIQNGDDLPTAIEKIGEPEFPKSMVALIKAGSNAGSTGKAIKHAAEFELEIARIKKQDSWSMWFAVAGFAISAISIFGTKFYFAPAIMESDLVRMSNGAVDTAWADMLMNVSVYLMGFLSIGFVFLTVLASIGRAFVPVKADKIVMRIPFYKDLVLARTNYITLFGLATMVENGVSMENSLQLSAESTNKGMLREDLNNAVKAIKNGRPWAMVMSNLHPTDRASLGSAQDRDQVARSIKAIADQYKYLYGRRVASTTPVLMLTSSLFLCIAGAVLFGLGVAPMLQIAAKASF